MAVNFENQRLKSKSPPLATEGHVISKKFGRSYGNNPIDSYRQGMAHSVQEARDAGGSAETTPAPSQYEQFWDMLTSKSEPSKKSDSESITSKDFGNAYTQATSEATRAALLASIQDDELEEQDETEVIRVSHSENAKPELTINTDTADVKGIEPEQPQAVPIIEKNTLDAMSIETDLVAASGQIAMTGYSNLRNLMASYRTGRLFAYGQASIDDMLLSEKLASTANTPSNSISQHQVDHQLHSFVQFYGQEGAFERSSSLPKSNYSGYGINTGIFSQMSDDLVMGLMFGVQSVSLNRKGGSGSVESVRLGPFLSWANNNWHFDAALTVGQGQYGLRRHDSNGGQLNAGFSGSELSGYAALGYDLPLDHWKPGLTLVPFAEAYFSKGSTGGYSEKSNSSQALKVDGRHYDQWLTRLGVETRYVLPDLANPTELNFKLGLQQQSVSGGNRKYELPNQNVSGQHKEKSFSDNGVFYSVGLDRKTSDNSSVSLSYIGTNTQKGLSHGLQLQFEWAF